MQRVLVILALFISVISYGQQIIPNDSTAAIPFELSGITGFVEESTEAIHQITDNLSNSTSSYEIFLNYEKIDRSYRSLRADTSITSFEEYNLWALTDLMIKWDKYQKDVESEKKKINNLAEKYQEAFRSFGLLDQKWKATQDSDEMTNAPESIVEQITSIRGTLAENTVWIEDSLSHTLERYNVVLNDYNELIQTKKKIKQVSDEKRLVIFSKDARPLFRAISDSTDSPDFLSQLRTSGSLTYSELSDYFRTNKRKAEWQIIMFLGLIALFYYFKRLYLRRNEEVKPGTEHAVYLIKNPVPVALVFGFFISFWFYSSPPPQLNQLFFLLMLAPILYLATGLVRKRFRTEMYFVGIVYALNLIGEFMPTFPLTQRVIILLLSIAISIYSVYALYFWSKKERDTVYKKWVFRLLIIYASFSIFSIYSNIVGALSLGRILTRTVVLNAAIGMVLIMCYEILQSLLKYFVDSRTGKKLNLIRLQGPEIIKRLLFYSKLFFIYLFIRSFLTSLYITGYVTELWEEFMNLGRDFGDLYLSVGQVVDFLLILFVFSIIASAIRALLEIEILPRTRVKKGIPMAVGMITQYTVLLLGFLMATAAAGLALDKIGFIIGAFGVGIGFGLQKVVGNFISGLILVLERPVRVGDVVTASETEGTITSIGIRASKIRDWDGAEVIIPNIDLITLKVTNWTFSDTNRRREIFIRTEPSANPKEVIKIAKEVIGKHDDVIKYPEPMVLFVGFKEFYYEFRILFWVTENMLQTTSDVFLDIWEALNEAGISTPVPKQEWFSESSGLRKDTPISRTLENSRGSEGEQSSDGG